MHLAGAFQIPSITTLGHCYDSALLHHKQWGYPENIILGKEVDNKIEHIAKVEQVYEKFKTILYSKERIEDLHIIGPYAPQKCGISDYIKLLINELNKRNIECIHTIIDQNNPLSNIAANLPNADLYSLQFAPYMFSNTGFSGQNLYKLGKSLNNRNFHINFHEIWIGAYNRASYKEKLIGYLQKKDILRFLSYSKPNVITASNSAAIER